MDDVDVVVDSSAGEEAAAAAAADAVEVSFLGMASGGYKKNMIATLG